MNNQRTKDSNDRAHAGILLYVKLEQAYSKQKQHASEIDPTAVRQTLYLQTAFFI